MDKVLSMHMQCNAMHQLLCYCQKLTLEKRREGKGIEAFLYLLSGFTKRHLLYCIYSIKVYLFFIRITEEREINVTEIKMVFFMKY